jgi:hypothetical protein
MSAQFSLFVALRHCSKQRWLTFIRNHAELITLCPQSNAVQRYG